MRKGIQNFSSGQARTGQAMLLMVLSIGGTILGATTIAGLLMIYQIRGATDLANSAKAVFAADAGTEWALYSYFNSSTAPAAPSFSASFPNSSAVSVTCYGNSGDTISCIDPNASYAISRGSARNTKRAFLVGFGSTQ